MAPGLGEDAHLLAQPLAQIHRHLDRAREHVRHAFRRGGAGQDLGGIHGVTLEELLGDGNDSQTLEARDGS